VVVVVVAVGVAGYLWLRSGALAADRAPGRAETFVARRLVRLSIAPADRARANPYAADADAWREAVDHFGEHCAFCHGTDGRGHSELGPLMYPPVPDLTGDAVQPLTDGEIFAVISRGVRWTGMPAFRSTDTEEEIWKLVSLIRRLPTLTPADLRPQPSDASHAHHHDSEEHTTAATIAIDGTSFQPDEVTVAIGEAVKWVNRDPFPHNVTSKAGGIHSGDIEPDESFEFHADRPGTFAYLCTLHPGMRGVLHVK